MVPTMSLKPAPTPQSPLASGSPLLAPASMVTLRITLVSVGSAPGQELALALPQPEWTKLISDFIKMPADERQRVGSSIRQATAHSPFPASGNPLSPQQQEQCDAFVSDCILLSALAEVNGPRMLQGTAMHTYTVLTGNHIKTRLN
jgi:hypothetical protein